MERRIDDDTPIRLPELAELMGMSLSTIYKYRKLGYDPVFGARTTATHFKAWLRDHYEKKRQAERADLKAAMLRLD